jgi:hypothetical protein
MSSMLKQQKKTMPFSGKVRVVKLRHDQEKIKPIPTGDQLYEKPRPVIIRTAKPYANFKTRILSLENIQL